VCCIFLASSFQQLIVHLSVDISTEPASGIGMKIWQCFDNLPAQAWFYTDDNRIAVTGQGTFFPACLYFPDAHCFAQFALPDESFLVGYDRSMP
jgi:hypothetical protein